MPNSLHLNLQKLRVKFILKMNSVKKKIYHEILLVGQQLLIYGHKLNGKITHIVQLHMAARVP